MWQDHHDELKAMLQAGLAEQEQTLKGFEKAKDIIVEYDVNQSGFGFSEQNECMTPTFKLRVPFLLKSTVNSFAIYMPRTGSHLKLMRNGLESDCSREEWIKT
ncbi:hypothetical protein BVRB_027950 [Beta vulgaris subsp. vulgaris]|uniref:Uncharacterized protein n=1 Tax=Beta vulgaris subsp. vulgaris TaxID=3555 RepID=A0A0J8B1L4_BETVV|nr:hypothetical protein BVRB_027950 [Beta vulgaris subsp. vulgaris]